MHDCVMDYLFDQALDELTRDKDRFLDWDEREPVNRPPDDEDSWEENCVTEKEWKRRNAIYSAEWKKEQEEIRKRYEGVKTW